MPFSEDDKSTDENFTLVQRLQFTEVISRISHENWMKGGLDTLLKTVKKTGSTDQT